MNCCELPGYIPSFPQTWRDELSALLCEILNERQNIDCQTVKECETVTSFNSFNLNGTTLSMSYTDERGLMTTRQVNLSTVNSNPYIFNNGLTNNSGIVQLGGNLIKPTIIGITNTPSEELSNYLWVKNHVGIGQEAARADSRLNVVHGRDIGRGFNFATKTLQTNFRSEAHVEGIHAGLISNYDLYITGGSSNTYTVNQNAVDTSIYATINYLNDSNRNIDGIISAITTSGIFAHGDVTAGGGVIEKFAGLRITAPTQLEPTVGGYQAKDFTGTIEDTYGILIEAQRGKLRNTATQQNTWGIYQKSNLDNNHFSGNTSFGPEDRNTNSSILTVKYGSYLDAQFPFVAVKALLSAGTGSGLGDSFSSTTSKLDIYASQLPASGFVSPTNIPFVYNPISSFESSVNYFSQSADVNVNVIGFKSALNLSSGTVEPDQTRPVINGGDIESVIGFLATRPLQILDSSLAIAGKYNGTINNTFGIYIEQQKSPDETGNPLTGFTQNNTWGVYQAGTTDKNYFAGQTGFGTNNPNASAAVQINSTTKGFLPPVMTEAQRLTISSPAIGLIVYQTDGTEGLYVRTSTGWRTFTMV